MARIGLLGGTFNPIHVGHLIVAEWVRDQLELQQVWFIPSARPPHKSEGLLCASRHRFQMVSLAIAGNPHFAVSDWEIRRPGKSFTVDTVQAFQAHFGRGARFFFIMGTDSALEITTWKEPETLLQLCQVVVVTRPGFTLDSLNPSIRQRLLVVDMPPVGISSSTIRARLKRGQSITYLVPKSVERYIYQQNLYSST